MGDNLRAVIEELRRLEREATPQPWMHSWYQAVDQVVAPEVDKTPVCDGEEKDCRFIAAVRNALPALLDLAERGLEAEPLQDRVRPWVLECFGAEIANDRSERNHRFVEEALELVQSCECPRADAHALVDYVYDREAGEPDQEVGGVMITLAALCLANSLDMHAAGERELARIWGKIDQIRHKQATKPRNSPLPAPPREGA